MSLINRVPRAELSRFSAGVGGLWLDDEWVSYTLENHARQIEAGEYVVVRDDKGKHKWFRLLDVFNRTDIEIHPANRTDELDGCIALGLEISNGGIVGGTSTPAMEKLSERLGDKTSFLLTIYQDTNRRSPI